MEAKVYRSGVESLRNWADVFGLCQADHIGGGRPKKRSYVQRLQVDFLSKMLADRSIVSVPICDDALLAEARQGRLSEADAILHRGEADYQFFELVDVRVGEKHQVNTTAYRSTRAMISQCHSKD